MIQHGKFVISVDFELMWGVWDKMGIDEYGGNVRGVHKALPRLLEVFDHFKIKTTFATVGLLFFETKDELLKNLPEKLPTYSNKNLSAYNGYLKQVGENITEDPYHFGAHLVKEILQYPEQEIGSHTFSHYYCLEEGQTVEEFKADILQAQKIAYNKHGLHLTSLVFPRNQFNNRPLV